MARDALRPSRRLRGQWLYCRPVEPDPDNTGGGRTGVEAPRVMRFCDRLPAFARNKYAVIYAQRIQIVLKTPN